MTTTLRAASGSSAENLFISLFEDVFGAEKTGYLYSQYPFFDIYQDSRFTDFLLENGERPQAGRGHADRERRRDHPLRRADHRRGGQRRDGQL